MAARCPVGCIDHVPEVRSVIIPEEPLHKLDAQVPDLRLDDSLQNNRIIQFFQYLVATVDIPGIDPVGLRLFQRQRKAGKNFFKCRGRGQRSLPGDRIVMIGPLDDGFGIFTDEFVLGCKDLSDSFRAPWIVITAVNTQLVDDGCGAQNAERVKERYRKPLFRQLYRDRGSVNARARYSNPALGFFHAIPPAVPRIPARSNPGHADWP